MTVLAHSLFKIAIHAQNPLKFSGIAQISKTFTISAHSGFPAGRQSETRRRRELIGQFGKVWFWTEPFPTALHLGDGRRWRERRRVVVDRASVSLHCQLLFAGFRPSETNNHLSIHFLLFFWGNQIGTIPFLPQFFCEITISAPFF